MADTPEPKFPEYVTDGHHIYLWHPEYESLLSRGVLKPSDPPAVKEEKALTPRQSAALEEKRKKALKDAEDQVELFKTPIPPAAAKPKVMDLDE